MSSAFDEPPDSGVIRSAEAMGASSRRPASTISRTVKARREVMKLRRREVGKAARIVCRKRAGTAAPWGGRAQADSVRRRTARDRRPPDLLAALELRGPLLQ